MGLPGRSDVEAWDTSELDAAATRWRTVAGALESAFEQHRRNILAPVAPHGKVTPRMPLWTV